MSAGPTAHEGPAHQDGAHQDGVHDQRALGRSGLLLLALALLVRGVYASIADTSLWFDHVFNDATAMGLLEGRGFTVSTEPPYAPAIFRTPGYPAFLAAVYGVFGHSVRAALWANALLDTASCWLLFRLAAPRVGASVARCVLLLAATYPFFVYGVGLLSPESLSIFLALVLVAWIDGWRDEGSWASVVAVGCLLGALGWIKPVFLPLPAFLLIAERMRGRAWRVAFARSFVVGIIAVAAIAPWVVRNQQALGRPVLAGELGIVVWHGTHDFSDERDPMIRDSFRRAADEGASHYESARGWFDDPQAELRESDELLAVGLERMHARPIGAYVLDPLRRVPRLWISTTYAIGPWWIGAGAAVACVGYLLAAGVGLVMLRGTWTSLAVWWILPLQLTLVYAALHVEARYTLPARPTLLLLAGVGVHGVWRRVRDRRVA